ncbi:MAG: hypothetical protein KF688_13945 [Pirellulales bacterium]|nr:hypothetical protein [Pirellulales bacterium]
MPPRSVRSRALAATCYCPGSVIESDWPDEEPRFDDDFEDDCEGDMSAADALADPWPADDELEEAFPEPGDFWEGDWHEDD